MYISSYFKGICLPSACSHEIPARSTRDLNVLHHVSFTLQLNIQRFPIYVVLCTVAIDKSNYGHESSGDENEIFKEYNN
jgi:hypothetical protein